MRRLRSGAPVASPSAADATAPRLRIVPDVPIDAIESGLRDLVQVLADLGVDVADAASARRAAPADRS